MHRDEFSQYHPLTNFLFFIGAIGFGVLIQHPAYVAAGLLCAGMYLIALNGKKAFPVILGLFPVFLILSAINPLFNTYGQTILFYLFGNPYTLEALLYGMSTAGMFVSMLLWFSCYSTVLTSDKFITLFGSMIPSLSLLLVMVLRMIPNLARKAAQIIGARKSIGKGAGENSAGKEKLTDGMRILSALTDWALEGSIVTADSMRSRGYGGAKRTSFVLYRFSLRDGVLIALMMILAALILLNGGTKAEFIPDISIEPLTWGFVAYCLFLIIPTALHIKEEIKWHISISKI